MTMEHVRIFIVGDIHGCLEMLERLLAEIKWHPDRDRLIFLGDYVDRGANAKGVIDLILDLLRVSSNVQCLIGNHEVNFLEYLSGGDIAAFLLNGGGATLSSYCPGRVMDSEAVVPEDHVRFMKSLERYIELEDYYVVHAGFRPGVDLAEQTLHDLTWIRDPFILSRSDFGKKVIFGHTPFSEPLIMENKIGLDTGAVYGNKLTCLELPSLKFHFVEA